MFSHAKQFIINGGTFVEQRGQRSDLDRLWNDVAPNALYNSKARFDPPRCHPDTRRAVLNRLHRWTQGLNNPDLPIAWIYGPAGAGKSAILQTMAEECDEIGTLLASFFFSTSDPTRNHPHGFVSTISCQIMNKIPILKPIFQAAMDRDPFIFNKSIEVQMQQLIVEPLKGMIAAGFFDDQATSPRLIVIDGFDECNDQALRAALLRAIARTLINNHVPIIFMISSRPEQDITHVFNSSPVAEIWVSLVLDDTFTPTKDIRRFLEDSFADIKATHPRRRVIPSHWPGESVIEHLVRKSSGQFLYSAVVIKYISTLSDLPHRRLDVVMGLRPATHDLPFAEIDALYTHLLSSLPDPGTETALDILFLVLFQDFPFGVIDLTRLLDMEDGDVELHLAPLSSIITIGPNVASYDDNSIISFSHASLSDFLCDRTRSCQFYMDMRSDRCIRLADQVVKYLNSDTWETAVSEAMRVQIHFISSRFLGFISSIIKSVDLNDELYEVLCLLKLENAWAQAGIMRSNEIPTLLRVLRNTEIHHRGSPWLKNYKQLYNIYIGSLAPILRSSVITYLSDATLTAYMIICLTRYQIRKQWYFKYWESHKITSLVQIPETFSFVDQDPLLFRFLSGSCSGIITDFLFDSTAPEHLSLRRRDFDNTAFRILTYLSKTRRRPSTMLTLRMKNYSRLKARSKKSNFKPHDFGCRELRTRRLQFGNTLKLSTKSKRFESCELGLRVLPNILKQCGGSQPLAEYICLHMKDIAVIKPWTQLARDALLDYLARTECDYQSELEVEVAYYEPTWDPYDTLHNGW